MTASPAQQRRADAVRSRAAILDAAVRLLNADPDARVEAVAAEAGVTRQTVYAHFPSRRKLLAAALDHVTDEAVAAMDAARLDEGPASGALLRLLDAGSGTAGRYPVLLRLAEGSEGGDHTPVEERLRRVIGRGQQSGEFDASLPVDWLVAVAITLGHAAAVEVEAGRMSREAAREALHTSLLRVAGSAGPTR
ncbi:TetR/AcrR family transcriptional regulator [Nonomuraea sp. NPDC050556]|uniref:TetR/AcrR family transcriptional regulator n=1 Tax=Nonomuraea sp. NPDC050556 TaxID=3364369 RepID=UPI00379ED29D